MLHPAEMELSETTQLIFDRVEDLAPPSDGTMIVTLR